MVTFAWAFLLSSTLFFEGWMRIYNLLTLEMLRAIDGYQFVCIFAMGFASVLDLMRNK